MKDWTTQAEQRLTEYLRERTVREGFDGEDAAELKDDLRRHIHEEAELSAAGTIGLMDLEQLLGKLDAGYRPGPAENWKWTPRVRNPRGGFWNWTFGVIFPALVLLLEMTTSMCGSLLFNPVPTWWHAAWIAMVPILNFWLIGGTRSGDDRGKGVAAGFAMLTAGFYGLMFLPLIHWAVLGLLFIGFGLLPLTPILSAIFSWRIGRKTRQGAEDSHGFKIGWRLGALAALLVFTVLEGPALWTRANLTHADAGGKSAEVAINRLRSFHSERSLLRACYEGNRGTGMGTDIAGWIFNLTRDPLRIAGGERPDLPDSDAVRDVFFRVTGKPFNSLKPPGNPRGGALLGSRNSLEEFEFDDHLGGDNVALRLKNLDLAESRLDGHVDSVSRLGYAEWTMVFKNGSREAKEARCQVKLPRDGRISRLTLWVNGEPREAAFSTVSKVKAAYKAIAVVQRRDPVLVTMVGPDTVMVQCFPVPSQGEMKIRIGVTAPLDDGNWELPRIVERNFGVAEGLEHALWLQGDQPFNLTGTAEKNASTVDGDGQALSVQLGGASLMESGIALHLGSLPEDAPVVWCEDRFAKAEGRFLVREPTTVTRSAADKLVVVVDGSLAMARAREWLAKSLGAVDAGKLTLILADDRARRVTPDELNRITFSGGRDNEPALRDGLRLARETNSPLVWIHGPQAVRLSQPEALLQQFERGTVHPVIYDVAVVPGPNRLAEAIYRTGCLRRGPSLRNPEKDITRFLEGLLAGKRETSWHWRRESSAEGLSGTKVWDQLARFWAWKAAEDPLSTLADSERSALAASYQLVTPLSGAVVLETQQQYDEHGLTPADGDATPKIPGVPEPSTGLLFLLTTAAALMRRKRPA